MNTALKCLVVEDEPIAAGILADYIGMVPFLTLGGTFHDPLEALAWLQKNKADVLFLDLNLPRLNGQDFLKSLGGKHQVIVTTAYHQYALDSYAWGVVDYLLKPIDFPRFVGAVNKLTKPAGAAASAEPQLTSRPGRFFNVNKTMVRVFYDEILYVESIKEYVRIYMAGRQLTTKLGMGELEQEMKPHGGLRIHRSFLVNMSHIEAYTANDVVVSGQEIPIGRQYRALVQKMLDTGL